MKYWLSKSDCTGCGACSNICPKNAISMMENENGFKYPVINEKKCINCELCKKTCPIINQKIQYKYNKKVFACWSKNEENRYISTSGGLFTEIAKKIIEKGGYVVGAAYNKDNMVVHKISHNINELEELRQSKYVQSDTNNIYTETKKLLNLGNLVAFAGSPCQIAALKKILLKEYTNLLTIEFICRGMNSPKAYRSWLSEIELLENKKIKKVWFKYKNNGWKTSPKRTRIDFADGSYKIYEGKDNKYMCGYLGPNLYIRPSCGNCKFNGDNRQADITLADFWGIDKELDDDKGTSLVIVNSENGEKYFNDISDSICCFERDIKEIYEGNVCFNTSVIINPKSCNFLKELNSNNFTKLVDKYSKVSLFNKVINKLKNVVRKLIK